MKLWVCTLAPTLTVDPDMGDLAPIEIGPTVNDYIGHAALNYAGLMHLPHNGSSVNHEDCCDKCSLHPPLVIVSVLE